MVSNNNTYNPQALRNDFPILSSTIRGNSLVYFDNSATTQKPQQVIDEVARIYSSANGSLNRSSHTLAQEAHLMYEKTRSKVLEFFYAQAANYEVTFTKNTTESLNLIAFSFFYEDITRKTALERSDSIILVSGQEHHSNLLPWMRLKNDFGFTLMSIPLDNDGHIDINEYNQLLKKYENRIKIVSVCHASNVIGHINDIANMISEAHKYEIPVVIDGAQTAAHIPINLADLNPEVFVASAHKMYGPAGVGIMLLKEDFASKLPPFLVGGGMVEQVNTTSYEPLQSAEKFLAGTPNLEGIAGTGAALEYLTNIGLSAIRTHEESLAQHFSEQMARIPTVTLIGKPYSATKLSLFAFTCPVHPHDVSDYLDQHGIAVRAGFHCAQHLHQQLGISATTRVSFGLYNSIQEIDYFFNVFKSLLNKFA